MKSRLILGALGRNGPLRLAPAELAEAQEQSRVVEAQRERDELLAIASAQSAERPWEEVEAYGAAHNGHGDIKTREREVYSEADSTLIEGVCVYLTCSECGEPLERWIVPPVPVPRRDLEARITELRRDLAEVVDTGRRPGRVQREQTARWRQIHVAQHIAEHRAHGVLRAGEGEPPKSGLSMVPPGETGPQVWVWCSGCRKPETWTVETPQEAARLLEEITRAIGGDAT